MVSRNDFSLFYRQKQVSYEWIKSQVLISRG